MLNRDLRPLRALAIGCLIGLSMGCAGAYTRYQPDRGVDTPVWDDPAYAEAIQLQYLGSGGYLISRGKHAILTAPLYTNPGWVRVGFGWISPDTSLIDRLHPRTPPNAVAAILVGHAHYDHLMDVPYLARKYHPQATIFGSRSTARLVAAADPQLTVRMQILDQDVARDGKPGQWRYLADSTIRIMALESKHGPHFMRLHLMQGEVPDDLKRLPRSAWWWKEGETLNYLIDFLDNRGGVDFRIHYADAASPGSIGLPPHFEATNSHPVDLALLCVGGGHETKEYPETLLAAIKPRHVILGHWEDFFRSPLKRPRRLRNAHIREFITAVENELPEDGDWLLPNPGSHYRYWPTAR